MQHSDFRLGTVFYSSWRAPQPYVVTDIGARVVVASIFVLPTDEPGEWGEVVIAPDELVHCTTTEPSNALHNNREDEARQHSQK